jgi:crotonobetainyl-CoA:carnitine CoA-transferase CaiB-like acyl-CoA transferase
MPGFGLEGPWRDVAAFAFVIEDASGLTWLTGYEDLLPIEPYCVGDPNAGLHALIGLLVALAHRDRTGEGSLVEAAMVDAALNIGAEQVIEHSAYGALLERAGNRGPVAAPQNVYQAAGPDDDGRDDSWVAVAVATDDQWTALRNALGEPDWASGAALATAAGRREAHDLLDEHLAAWCRQRSADEIVAALWPAGVPVGKVMQPHQQPDVPQLADRSFFEELGHPVIGSCRYSTMPMRFSAGPARRQVRPAPLLGQHNEELLSELGLTRGEIDELAADGVIGNAVAPAGGY